MLGIQQEMEQPVGLVGVMCQTDLQYNRRLQWLLGTNFGPLKKTMCLAEKQQQLVNSTFK